MFLICFPATCFSPRRNDADYEWVIHLIMQSELIRVEGKVHCSLVMLLGASVLYGSLYPAQIAQELSLVLRDEVQIQVPLRNVRELPFLLP